MTSKKQDGILDFRREAKRGSTNMDKKCKEITLKYYSKWLGAEALNQGKIPLWSTGVQNTASQKLAEKVGFIKLADVLTLSL